MSDVFPTGFAFRKHFFIEDGANLSAVALAQEAFSASFHHITPY
jgi:hypothetical protein